MNVMMMSTLHEVPANPVGKARSNSEDVSPREDLLELDYDYSLERAASSEALLPSYQDKSDDGIECNSANCSSTITSYDDGRDSSPSSKDDITPRAHNHQQQHFFGSSSPRRSSGSSFARLKAESISPRLQTIESGIALADSANESGQISPKRNGSASGSAGSLPPLPHGGSIGSVERPEMAMREVSHTSQLSTISHYSADAGKHGFITHLNDGDTDSIANDSANGSLVFKYQPGQETPPADYALPASILRVYGETPAEHDVEQGGPAIADNSNTMPWHRSGTESTGGSQGSIFFTHSADSQETNENESLNRQESGGSRTSSKAKPRVSPRGSPRESPKLSNPSSLRIPHLLGAAPSDDSSEKVRILPYHERKRLMQLEEEEKRRKKNLKNMSKSKRGTPKNGEKTPLTPKQRGGHRSYGTDSTSNTTNDTADADQSEQQQTGWFGQLVSIVTGKRDERDEQRIQEETDDFRKRGEAFLKKTEKERMKLKEQNRMEELNNVTVPVTNHQSFGPHKARMSSLSAALDSIVSISEDDEGEESSDEESGSYFLEQEPARVWKYGEPPTTANGNTPKKNKVTPKGKKMSKRDWVMRQERLMQEEYEYRLHTLKRENEKLSKRFRVFVLVTVALIFAGALAFAFVVCVRMLMSI